MTDHVLVLGFGGPTRPEEIRPFLQEVTRGARVPPERLEDVAHHYEAVGGRSPYTEHAERLVARLTERLSADGIRTPVFLGMRYGKPSLQQAAAAIRAQGLRHGLGIPLAPHRCEASFERYVRALQEAQQAEPAHDARYQWIRSWHADPGFIEAQAEQVRAALQAHAVRLQEAVLVFTAHSIPSTMASRSRYAQEFEESSRLVARRLGATAWRLAYQSRSGPPEQPWLEPDVRAALSALRAEGARAAVAVPIGFLCDHVEVLFDLDIEARQEAERLGLAYVRAPTVMDHPAFVAMLAGLIREHLAAPAAA